MRRHAKAPSAGSTSGTGNSRARFGRAFATRGGSCDVDGSGASAYRRPAAAALALFALLILVVAPAANAGRVPGFGQLGTGTTGAGAGQLSGEQGFAVNTTGAGGATAGDVYVSDGANNRVSQFSASGTFIRSFGRNVVASGPDDNTNSEVQSVRIVAGSGTFTLKFGAGTTGAIPYNAPASGGVGPTASVQNALEALATIGAGNVTVTGGPGDATGSAPYVVTFGGTQAGKNLELLTIVNPSGLGVAAGTQLSCTGGPATSTLNYQWLANGESLGSANGAQTSTYAIQPGDAGKVIQCRVLANGVNSASAQASAPSLGAEVVADPYPATAPPTTTATTLAAPAVVGGGNLTAAGKKLTCAAGTWTGSPTFSFQWYRNGVPLSGNGANTSEYTVQAADVASAATFQCQVIASNPGGKATLFSSNRNTASPLSPPSAPPVATAAVPALSSTSTTVDGSGPEVCVAGVDTCQAGESLPLAGALAGIRGLAVDPAAGNVFVLSNTNERVDVFSATGKYEGSFGWRANAASPEEQLQFCTLASGCLAAKSGAAAGQLASLTGANQAASSPAVSPLTGNLYVPDPGNRRVEEFSLTLNGSKEVTGAAFVRAAGGDVRPTINEQQTVAITGAAGGTFALSQGGKSTDATGAGDLEAGSNEVVNFKAGEVPIVAGEEISGPGVPVGTRVTAVTFDSLTLTQPATETVTAATLSAALPFDALASAVQAALRGLPAIGAGNASVTGGNGGPFTVEFTGSLAGVDVAQISGDPSNLTGAGPAVEVTTTRTGANGSSTDFEVCTVATTCKIGGTERSSNLTFEGKIGMFGPSSPSSVSVDSTGAVYVTGQPTFCDETNCRVQKFDSALSSPEEFVPSRLTSSTGSDPSVVAPRYVAVDPANDHVLVVKKVTNTTAKLYEFTRTGSLVDISPPGEAGLVASSNGPGGIAVGTEGRAYYSAENGNSIVKIMALPPSPNATVEEPSDVTQTSATFRGIAQPSAPGVEGGFASIAFFEYSTDGVSWKGTDPIEIGTGAGAGNPNTCPTGNPPSCNLSQLVAGLKAGTTYLVRLAVSNGTKATSATVQFTTGGATPGIANLGSSEVTKSEAVLNGEIEPNGKVSSYHFEWGPTMAYGTRVPADFEAVAGGGSDPIPVSIEITGLQAATTYHFRIVAKSNSGTTVSRDQEVTTLNDQGLPSNRGYELASPANKRPVGDVVGLFNSQLHFQAAEQGGAVAFSILNGLEDSTSGGEMTFVGTREAEGWNSNQVTPPSIISSPDSGPLSAAPGRVRAFSGNLDCGVVESFNPLTGDTPQADIENGVQNLYLWHRDAGTYTLITPPPPIDPTVKMLSGLYFEVSGISDDCSRVFFRSAAYVYIPGASGLYEWHDGHLADVGLRPDGSVASGVDGTRVTRDPYTVSKNNRFFFMATSNEAADNGKRAVFVRKSLGDIVNASKPTSGGPTQGATYVAASPDGSRAFFLANYGIASTSSSGPTTGKCAFGDSQAVEGGSEACDLYEYNVENGSLTDISATTSSGNTNGAVAIGTLDVSEDGKTVYFAARGQLTPGGGRTYAQNLGTDAGYANVYRYHEGATSYVGSLAMRDTTDSSFGTALTRDVSGNASQTTKTGDYLAFPSSADITGTNPGHQTEVYLYSAETNATECVSCPRNRNVSQRGDMPSKGSNNQAAGFAGNHDPVSLGENGRVVFMSGDQLAPGAVLGESISGSKAVPFSNVYESLRGQVSLLASGKVQVVDTGGGDGQDVYIKTYEQFLPEDIDFSADIYDLRIGSPGFSPPAPEEPCDPAADQCQGSPGTPPTAETPPSVNFVGPDNPAQKGSPGKRKCGKGKVRSHGKCVKKKKKAKAHNKRATAKNHGGVK